MSAKYAVEHWEDCFWLMLVATDGPKQGETIVQLFVPHDAMDEIQRVLTEAIEQVQARHAVGVATSGD